MRRISLSDVADALSSFRLIWGLMLVAGLFLSSARNAAYRLGFRPLCFGCPTAPDTSYVGSYSLVSLNGGDTQAVLADRVRHTDAAIWLYADGTYLADILNQDCFVNGCTSIVKALASSGSWTRKNNEFTLVDPKTGQTFVCSYANKRLTTTDTKDFAVSTVLVFEKDSVTRMYN
jgi:hypothetical protein